MPFYELHINCFLREDTPLEVIQAIRYMVSEEKINKPDYVNYSKANLFKNELWEKFLVSNVPHFPFNTHSAIFRSMALTNVLMINSSFLSKNEEIIHEFLDWIKPYLHEVNDFIGYFREFHKAVNFLYFKDRKIKIHHI